MSAPEIPNAVERLAAKKPAETEEQRAQRRAELKTAIIAYKKRHQHAPVEDWDSYIFWCERQHATASKFNASKPAPGL